MTERVLNNLGVVPKSITPRSLGVVPLLLIGKSMLDQGFQKDNQIKKTLTDLFVRLHPTSDRLHRDVGVVRFTKACK